MDSIINTAVEEICCQLDNGLTLTVLWSKLQPFLATSNLDLSPGVKKAIWANLLRVPTLRFVSENELCSSDDPSIQSFEDAEKLNLKIVAQQNLMDNFFGIYNVPSVNAKLPPKQRRALQHIVAAKTNGITQSQLGDELGVKKTNMFYVLRQLECQGLIVKHSAVERKKETCIDGKSKYHPCVTTNMIYLNRYAQRLGSQQRFEITKEEQIVESLVDANGEASNRDGLAGDRVKIDIHIKDYTPQVNAIRDKLEKANNKVLVVSDIKKDLGYCGSPSRHRAWREIFRLLKENHIVEQFEAKVNNKIEVCLRLLKPLASGSGGEGQKLKCGKKCQISEQLVELPIECQIYDMIDAAGPDGLSSKEMCERLGIDHKKNYSRLLCMLSRFGMNLQAEQHEKVTMYRFWTSRNFNPELATAIHTTNENKISDVHIPDILKKKFCEYDTSTFNENLDASGEMEDTEKNRELSGGSPVDTDSEHMALHPNSKNLQKLVLDSRGTASDVEHSLVSAVAETDVNLSGTSPPTDLKQFKTGSFQRYPCLSPTVDGTRREKRILQRLEDEKFILKPEMRSWLTSFEKDKGTTIDRKTIDRILIKLQEQGQCKCIEINVPVMTNFSNSRSIQVVVHPSVQSLPPELLCDIQDRVRSFEVGIRSQCSFRQKDNGTIPVLEDIERSQNCIDSDYQAIRAGAMRANGFILAKMIRAKLLHSFLWDYVHSSVSSSDASSSEIYEQNNPHRSSKLFSLEASIRAIPVELFLQVVGSTQKYDDMLQKCKMGLHLLDLPLEEYKILMNTHATGRLSLVIDILRRLKLIRMVTDVQSKDGIGVPHTAFTHAMELKPYIEEPLSKDATSFSFRTLDLRPRIRHDFVLSNREAVNKYWQTLEYCYAAADQKAALLAFPGSAVHEVFRYRSWASVRLMTAEQRGELLKRVMKDDTNEKMSLKECEMIAKDLNLTLEQVLRVYYDRRQQRLNKYQIEGNEYHPLGRNHDSSRRRRKRSSEASSAKHPRIDTATGQLVDQRLGIVPDTVDQIMEEQNALLCHSGEHNLPAFQEEGNPEIEDLEANEDEESCPLITQCLFSKMKPTRQKRFSWTDETDRQLVVQYARRRAALGANYHRVDWASLSGLPAPPSTCQKRMVWLNSNTRFRKSVMRLCNILSERYAEYLEKIQNMSMDKDDCRLSEQCSSKEGLAKTLNRDVETHETGLKEEPWDDFENKKVKIALDEVLHCKKIAKLEASKKVRSLPKEWSELDANTEEYNSEEYEGIASTIPNEVVQNHGRRRQKIPAQRLRRDRVNKKINKLSNDGVNVNTQVYQSLAISNAVELFKLIFLSSSTAAEVPNLLAEILRRYSEHDLFAAFNYLRMKKIMNGGNESQPFELSQQFLHSVSRSPFPSNTGKRAGKFACWLHERNKELTEGGTDIAEDLQCGDIFQLFAVVSSGELSISPTLPDNGVGEAEDLRSSKRKIDSESSDGGKAKKLKSLFALEGEVISRREKGFPGISVSANRVTISRVDTVDLFKDFSTCTRQRPVEGNAQPYIFSGQICASPVDDMQEILNAFGTVPVEEHYAESPWEAMTRYARHLMLVSYDTEQENAICSEVFRDVYEAIQKAGDQGLSMEEVSQVIDIPGVMTAGLIVDVLQGFGWILKVNAYNSVRVVDALYRSKYFLTSVASSDKSYQPPSMTKSIQSSSCHLSNCTIDHDITGAKSRMERDISIDDVHKVTILNFPEEGLEPSNKNPIYNKNEGSSKGKVVSHGMNYENEKPFPSGEVCMPILPWINGDGTINNIVYKGLQRRVLGIVMQNPGILEDDIICQIDALNQQNCKTLLESMILDKHLIVRMMHQTKLNAPPALLRDCLGSTFSKSKSTFRKHFFANPMSTSFL
ncbi:putative B-block-binding subunit of tfiiic protein [Quillaja saponaria]|uniref:B-block-binding subunit of tfiiic protein n=1 Tax=Quillaja saponaria TaxID=32244 RepID=A0AAD7PDH0_QUISA|nr:putative B-block-binding subunit of tfiiic protein [Quillaja saponaria]